MELPKEIKPVKLQQAARLRTEPLHEDVYPKA